MYYYSYDKESLITHRESGHLFNVPSERRQPTQGNVPNHCPAELGKSASYWPYFQQDLISHPGTDQDPPCLATMCVCVCVCTPVFGGMRKRNPDPGRGLSTPWQRSPGGCGPIKLLPPGSTNELSELPPEGVWGAVVRHRLEHGEFNSRGFIVRGNVLTLPKQVK